MAGRTPGGGALAIRTSNEAVAGLKRARRAGLSKPELACQNERNHDIIRYLVLCSITCSQYEMYAIYLLTYPEGKSIFRMLLPESKREQRPICDRVPRHAGP